MTKILAIPGSGRKGSYNRALLEAAKELLPENTMFEIFEVANLPLFTQDREKDPQPEVHAFKQKIKEADAILFATPEHNYSISAVLKNAIEWANRLDEDNAWYGKPAAIVSASTGPRGGARAQLHLRQIMVDVKMYPINEPELYLAKAEKAFDANLRLIDEGYRETLKMILQNLVSWSKKLRND